MVLEKKQVNYKEEDVNFVRLKKIIYAVREQKKMHKGYGYSTGTKPV
jgi:hypothetical protein